VSSVESQEGNAKRQEPAYGENESWNLSIYESRNQTAEVMSQGRDPRLVSVDIQTKIMDFAIMRELI